jgi:hypothetical protein
MTGNSFPKAGEMGKGRFETFSAGLDGGGSVEIPHGAGPETFRFSQSDSRRIRDDKTLNVIPSRRRGIFLYVGSKLRFEMNLTNGPQS